MMRYRVWIVCLLCCSPLAWAKMPYNYVKDVRIAGVSIGNIQTEQTYQMFQQIVADPQAQETLTVSECMFELFDVKRTSTGTEAIFTFYRYQATPTVSLKKAIETDQSMINYGDPIEWNPQMSKDQIQKIAGDIQKISLKAESPILQAGTLYLDHFKIHAGLSFKDFKKRFPQSAKQQGVEQEDGSLDYYLFFFHPPGQEEPMYLDPTIALRFKNGVLQAVEISRDNDC